jgi:hypothetical protein
MLELLHIGICRHHASELTNYFSYNFCFLYNAHLSVSHTQKWYKIDIS